MLLKFLKLNDVIREADWGARICLVYGIVVLFVLLRYNSSPAVWPYQTCPTANVSLNDYPIYYFILLCSIFQVYKRGSSGINIYIVYKYKTTPPIVSTHREQSAAFSLRSMTLSLETRMGIAFSPSPALSRVRKWPLPTKDISQLRW